MIRSLEQQAPEAIAELIPMLTMLTIDQPTTAEIEEALLASKAITRALFEWLGARYSAKAASIILAHDVCSPELDFVLGETEDRQNRVEVRRPVTCDMVDIAAIACGMKQRPA